jgi:hypothetical protein
MGILKIRYNTEHNNTKLKWRVCVLPSWEETLVEDIMICTGSYTTEDILPDGRVKYHITVNYTETELKGNVMIIK